MEKTPCYLADSDEARLLDDPSGAEIEEYADYLMEECRSADYCRRLIVDYEMVESCAAIMAEIASWSGRSSDANGHMLRLFVLLAEELGEIAKMEVGK